MREDVVNNMYTGWSVLLPFAYVGRQESLIMLVIVLAVRRPGDLMRVRR
jgi:hypothetical protein